MVSHKQQMRIPRRKPHNRINRGFVQRDPEVPVYGSRRFLLCNSAAVTISVYPTEPVVL